MSGFETWVSVAANLVAVGAGVATAIRLTRKWLTSNVSEKLDSLAKDVRTLAAQHTTLAERFDNHVRDHDIHRRTWRF